MRTKTLRTYLRTHRRAYGLSQRELADLVGTHKNCISDYEREESLIPVRLLIAIELVFGLPGAEVFPALFAQVEEEVCAAALMLDKQLDGKFDARSIKKRELLSRIPDRVKPIEV